MKVVALDAAGNVVLREVVACRECAVKAVFGKMDPCVVALETGGHTTWLGRLLAELKHEVVVANARKVRAISANERKSDWRDAEMLARLVRSDRTLLCPVRLRGKESQADMILLKARDAAVRARALMVNTARALVKGTGERVRACSTEAFPRRCRETLGEETVLALTGLLAGIEAQTEVVRGYDRKIKETADEHRRASDVNRVAQVTGVGTHTALAFVVTLEEAQRFGNARQIGAFLGLTPRRDQSGATDKALGITHAGNPMLRRLMVNSAQYIMGPFGPDCDLRRFGTKLIARGGKAAKKRAIIAVARKLSVLLLRLWQTGETYEPVHVPRRKPKAA